MSSQYHNPHPHTGALRAQLDSIFHGHDSAKFHVQITIHSLTGVPYLGGDYAVRWRLRGVEKRISRKQSRASSRGRDREKGNRKDKEKEKDSGYFAGNWTDKAQIDASPERSRSPSPARSDDSYDSDDEQTQTQRPPRSPTIPDSGFHRPPSSFHYATYTSSSGSSSLNPAGPSRVNSGSSFASYMSSPYSTPPALPRHSSSTDDADTPTPAQTDTSQTPEPQTAIKYEKASRGTTEYLPLIAHRVNYEHRFNAVVSMFVSPPTPVSTAAGGSSSSTPSIRPGHSRNSSTSNSPSINSIPLATDSPSTSTSTSTPSGKHRPSLRRTPRSASVDKEPGLLQPSPMKFSVHKCPEARSPDEQRPARKDTLTEKGGNNSTRLGAVYLDLAEYAGEEGCAEGGVKRKYLLMDCKVNAILELSIHLIPVQVPPTGYTPPALRAATIQSSLSTLRPNVVLSKVQNTKPPSPNPAPSSPPKRGHGVIPHLVPKGPDGESKEDTQALIEALFNPYPTSISASVTASASVQGTLFAPPPPNPFAYYVPSASSRSLGSGSGSGSGSRSGAGSNKSSGSGKSASKSSLSKEIVNTDGEGGLGVMGYESGEDTPMPSRFLVPPPGSSSSTPGGKVKGGGGGSASTSKGLLNSISLPNGGAGGIHHMHSAPNVMVRSPTSPTVSYFSPSVGSGSALVASPGSIKSPSSLIMSPLSTLSNEPKRSFSGASRTTTVSSSTSLSLGDLVEYSDDEEEGSDDDEEEGDEGFFDARSLQSQDKEEDQEDYSHLDGLGDGEGKSSNGIGMSPTTPVPLSTSSKPSTPSSSALPTSMPRPRRDGSSNSGMKLRKKKTSSSTTTTSSNSGSGSVNSHSSSSHLGSRSGEGGVGGGNEGEGRGKWWPFKGLQKGVSASGVTPVGTPVKN